MHKNSLLSILLLIAVVVTAILSLINLFSSAPLSAAKGVCRSCGGCTGGNCPLLNGQSNYYGANENKMWKIFTKQAALIERALSREYPHGERRVITESSPAAFIDLSCSNLPAKELRGACSSESLPSGKSLLVLPILKGYP